AISPGRRCRRIAPNSALASRSRAFSARIRNRMLLVANHAWKTDMDQASSRQGAGGDTVSQLRGEANAARRLSPSTLSLRSATPDTLRPDGLGAAAPRV